MVTAPVSSAPEIAGAVQSAQRLLQYASMKGIALEEDLVAEIVDARRLIGLDENDPAAFDQQKRFWASLARLTTATAPATIDSIRYTSTTKIGWWHRLRARLTRTEPVPTAVGELAVRRAGLFALSCLIVFGGIQAYVETASATIHDYYVNQEKWEKNDQILSPVPADQQTSEPYVSRKTENAMLRAQTERQLLIMQAWLRWLPWVQFAGEDDSLERAKSVLAATEGILTVLRGFLLPAGWGLIGAALYVSRTLAEDLRTRAYSDAHATLHHSRYYLGAVAGFVVAKFSTALSGKAVDDVVQPFVLALLVGYSVDVLFNLLDKLIATFTSKS